MNSKDTNLPNRTSTHFLARASHIVVESEKTLERKLRKEVEKRGGQALKLMSQLHRGLPDRLILMPGGRTYFAEIKTTGKKPTELQRHCHGQLRSLGFKYDLLTLHISRGMNADGTYFSRLTDYELTDEVPPKPEGETVRLGSDAENMAPDRVRDPRNERLHGPKRRKGARPEDTEEPEEARRILTLQDYQDEDLCDELRARGYHGEITKTKTIKI